MSEKKYLLTVEDESIADSNALRQVIQTARFNGFEIYEHEERTCEVSNDYGDMYDCSCCGGGTALFECVNENGYAEWVKPRYCASYGAKVVER